MISVYLFDILNYIINRQPDHRRTGDRISCYQILTVPFKIMWDEWVEYRDKSITRANVSNQTISQEWYLNYLFNPAYMNDNTQPKIYIETADPLGIAVGLSSIPAEVSTYLVAGDSTLGGAEALAYNVIPLVGEDLVTGTAAFAVFVPSALMAFNNDIKGVVNNYRLAGKTFTIINY